MFKKIQWSAWWVSRGAFVLAALFVVVFTGLMVRKHDAFNTHALDLAKFDQAIWNTLHGRFLFSTIQNKSILANHFSPFMAFLAPLFLLYPNIRVLFLAQTVGLAVAGLFLYGIVRVKHPTLATWFLLAFYLNPALHEVALVDFRRVTLAVPFLAMALYALYVRNRWLMAVGLALALLCKEDIALIVFMTGVYLLLFERDWKWGALLAIVGLAWAITVMLWVIPAFIPSGGPSVHLQANNFFCLEGDTYGEIVANAIRNPGVFFQRMFDRAALRALWRVFLPLGFVLPLLAMDWSLIVLPTIAYMLMSCNWRVHELRNWYLASVLPGLFAAMAVAWSRMSGSRARRLAVGLLCTTIVGYGLFSYAPLGGNYDPSLYQVTAHHRLASEVVAAVPPDARVAAQDPYVPHLSHREHIYLYPWIAIGEENIDYFLLDQYLPSYPLRTSEVNDAVQEMMTDPVYVIESEADGIYLFHKNGSPLPSFSVDRVADGFMKLERVEVAVCDERGFFHTVEQQPIELKPGQEMRVSLYWQAVGTSEAERTVSVRIADASGVLVAVHDNPPGMGKKPTSQWRVGMTVRDVHYLTVLPEAQPGPGSLNVLLYDSFSLDTVSFEDGTESVKLCDVILSP